MFARLADQIGDLFVFAAAALIFGIVRLLLLPGGQPVKVYLASIATSIPVGTLAGALCLELGVPDIASMAGACTASLLAHDFLLGIMNNRVFLGQLLKRAAENLTDKVTK
ncbi:hypothetical protein [Micavibrio aeruginosavorus]|uniref:Holin n=1 Tax=Micavibrio aeruginosavorus (strain ARL-13) TaxID=856793 RepID=G2KLQ0_MICAA|nr:hypothetical protein [Micavibrio aeruginosavorus]AEP08880.1 hypothetical protein MICA_543 [Micavibrio aeruginosavorus ARL-13]